MPENIISAPAEENSPEISKLQYAKIDPKSSQERPGSTAEKKVPNIKVPNINLSNKKSIEQMNEHLEKVQVNIAKG